MILFRILLLPFTLLYGTGILMRNLLYSIGILSRTSFDLPVICVGNLSVGGTGKTPHIEWLLENIPASNNPAVLSRGYKRKTKGYRFASVTSGTDEIGDEPFQLKQKFPQVPLAVSESRVLGIPELLGDAPDTGIILMDDGFQHLPLKASGYILLTDFNNRYTQDWVLPSGMLREFRFGAARADIIVVTKCPHGLNEGFRKKITEEIKPKKHQKVIFSEIAYGNPINLHTGKSIETLKDYSAICFSGLANPAPFIKYASRKFDLKESFSFRDHHRFSESDMADIMRAFESIKNPNKIILCTEKDAGKLRMNNPDPEHLYYLPIKIEFQKNGAEILSQYIQKTIKSHLEQE